MMPSDALLLSIETSGEVCSVALHQGGQLLAYTELHQEKSHAERLTLAIEQLLALVQRPMHHLAAVAVSGGPGSYTGLRIGVSTAKGLCFALNIPLLAVNTLQAMAAAAAPWVRHPQALLCPMLDARRQEVYMALYDTQLSEKQATTAHILGPESLAEVLAVQPVYVFGNGAAKALKVIHSPQLVALPPVFPSARHIGQLAWQQPQQVDVVYFEPNYLKPFYSTGLKKDLT